MHDFADAEAVMLFPNPTDCPLQITGSDLKVNAVQIFDITGREVFAAAGKTNFNIARLSQGMYFVKIITDKNAVTKKIIKR